MNDDEDFKQTPEQEYKSKSKLNYRLIEIVAPERFINKFPKGLETIRFRLEHWDYVNAYFYGRHWLDKPENSNSYVEPHWHIYIQFKGTCTFKTLLNKIHGYRIEEDTYERASDESSNCLLDLNNFQRVKGRYSSCLDYLYHTTCTKKELEYKHLYTEEEMKPYFYSYGMCKEDIANDDSSNYDKTVHELDMIIKGIESGIITYRDFVENKPNNLISNTAFVRYKREIRDVFDRIYYTRFKEMERSGEYKMDVYYFYGPTGVGKTDFAKDYAISHNLSFYVTSAGKNPFDDYNYEDVIIFDDWRSDKLPFEDMLKLLDPYNSAKTAARYHNVTITAKVIIITTDASIEDAFQLKKPEVESTNDARLVEYNKLRIQLKQFMRRCEYVFEFPNRKDIIVKRWAGNGYENTGLIYNNPIDSKYAHKAVSEEESKVKIENLMSTMNVKPRYIPDELKGFM